MIHTTCYQCGFRYDKLEDSIIVLEQVEGDSKEQRSFFDQGSPEESLSFREEDSSQLVSSALLFSLSLYIFILRFSVWWRSLQVVIKITPLISKQVSIYRTRVSRCLYRVSRGTIFAPFNFDYESPHVTVHEFQSAPVA